MCMAHMSKSAARLVNKVMIGCQFNILQALKCAEKNSRFVRRYLVSLGTSSFNYCIKQIFVTAATNNNLVEMSWESLKP